MNKPILYMMLGYPGAGKTTVAKILHELTGAVHLSSDKLRMELFHKPTFSQAEHDILYQTLNQKTEELLSRGKDVVYDANLNRYEHRKEKYDIGRRVDAKPLLLWVQASRGIAKQRAAHIDRLHLWPEDESPHDMFDRVADVIEEPIDTEPYIVVDGTKVSEEYIASLLRQHV